jgi:hypothetical protein
MPNGTSLAYVSRAGTRLGFAATTSKTRQLIEDEKANVSGETLCRDGDLVRLRDKQTHEVVALNILDATQIGRKNHEFPLYRHTDMDVAALRPGLTIDAEGIGNSSGQLEASKISFTPEDFAIEAAEEQQVLGNRAAAQSTASQAATAAGAAPGSCRSSPGFGRTGDLAGRSR